MIEPYNFKIRVFVNGQTFLITQSVSISNFLDYLNYKPDNAILEWNKKLLSFHESKNVVIRNGDILEILSVVGGGWLRINLFLEINFKLSIISKNIKGLACIIKNYEK